MIFIQASNQSEFVPSFQISPECIQKEAESDFYRANVTNEQISSIIDGLSLAIRSNPSISFPGGSSYASTPNNEKLNREEILVLLKKSVASHYFLLELNISSDIDNSPLTFKFKQIASSPYVNFFLYQNNICLGHLASSFLGRKINSNPSLSSESELYSKLKNLKKEFELVYWTWTSFGRIAEIESIEPEKIGSAIEWRKETLSLITALQDIREKDIQIEDINLEEKRKKLEKEIIELNNLKEGDSAGKGQKQSDGTQQDTIENINKINSEIIRIDKLKEELLVRTKFFLAKVGIGLFFVIIAMGAIVFYKKNSLKKSSKKNKIKKFL